MKKKYYLCYIDPDNKHAFFSERYAENNWGDDWDDAPYEHNAGEPYDEDFDGPELGVKNGRGIYNPIDIKEFRFILPFEYKMPCDGHLNSPYSVEQINNREVPWISSIKDDVKIYANTTIEEFEKYGAKMIEVEKDDS